MKQNITITLGFILGAFLIFWACSEEDSQENIEPPLVSTTEISNITTNTAVAGGNVTAKGGAPITARGVCWNTESNPTIDCNYTSDGTSTGSFSSNLTGLDNKTTYYVRAYATNAGGTAYGNETSFTTLDGLPVVTTNEVTSITSKSAVCNATVSGDGGEDVTVRGICWNTSQNPTIACDHTISGSDTGSFICNITNLERNTSYYVRAYATNMNGTAYGNELSFTTTNDIPILTTAEITNITDTSAISGGNISDDNGYEVTARGVCWSNSSSPTLNNNYTEDGTGTGTFNSNLSNLQSNTTYYVRAYATNSQGTAYGNEINFITGNNFCESSIPNETNVLRALENFIFDGTDVASVTEAENILKFLCPDVNIHFNDGYTVCGIFPTGYHLTLWTSTYGLTDRYGARYGLEDDHSFWSNNDVYFEIIK